VVVLILSHEWYLLILAAVCLYVSVTDFMSRKIHHYILFILFFLQFFLSPLDVHIMSFFLVLGGGLLLYALIGIGAGDIKYAAVLSFVIPLHDLLPAFIMMAYAGGFLAIIYLLSKKLIKITLDGQEGLPYGIAISVGFYLVILTQNVPRI